ncbi:putative MFS family arabinose efflux permease [Arthrobacter sp. GAS37]|uniref:MFS transporter n=1 Tax=Arthrobacter sp. GAS37 TaxID=3156261 RepID=UPI003838EE6A
MTTTATPPTGTRSSLLPLVVLSLCGFTSITTELLPSGLLTRIASDLGTGIAGAGSLTSVYAAAIVVTVLPLTRFTIRVPRRVLFAAILSVFAAANILVALSATVPIAITGRVLAGVAHGLLWAIMVPIVGRITNPARAAGTPLGTLLGQALGWRTAFLILAHFAVLTYIAPFLEHAGLGDMVGAGLAILGIAGLAGVALAGRVPRRALFAGLLSAPTLIVAGLLGLGVLPMNLATALVLLSIWGAGYAAAAVFDQQVVFIVGHEAPDTVTSLSVVAIQLGIALGGLTVEALGVAWIPVTGAVFAAVSVALRSPLRRYLPRHTPTTHQI